MSKKTQRPDIFVSATSGDLTHIRKLAKEALYAIDCHPIEQEHFPPDYRSVSEMLRERIEGCEAVLHIVGIRYGEEPDPETLPEGVPRRSYTQMEADIARELGKKLYLFVCPEEFPFGEFEESEEKRALQMAYREEVARDEQLRTSVHSEEEVSLRVRELQTQIESLRSQVTTLEDSVQGTGKSLKRMWVLGVLGLVVLSGLIWWTTQQFQDSIEEFRYSPEQRRDSISSYEQTRRGQIEQAYKKMVADIDNDPKLTRRWADRERRKDELKEKYTRDLLALDRVILSMRRESEGFTGIPESDNFLRIINEEGESEALKFYDSKQNENDQRIESLLEDLKEDPELRGRQRFALTAANTAVTANEWEKATGIFEALLKQDPAWADALGDYANFLLYLKGPREGTHGTTKGALTVFERALEVTNLHFALYPRDQKLEREIMVSFGRLGDLQLRLGETEKALSYYQDALGVAEKLVELDPKNTLYQRDLTLSLDRLGDVQLRLGETEKALNYYRDCLSIREKLVEQDPKNAEYQRDLSLSFDQLGDLQLSLGGTKKALNYYQEGLSVAKDLVELDPKNAKYQRDLSVWFDRLGDLQLRLGGTEKALIYYQDGLSIAEKLVKLDPKNAEYQRGLSVSFNNLGEIHLRLGGTEKALKYYENGLGVRGKLVELDPKNAQYQCDLTLSFDRLGDVQLRLGETEKALTYYEYSLGVAEKLVELDPKNAEYQSSLSLVFLKLGDFQLRLGETEKALNYYQDCLRAREKLVEINPRNAEYQRDLSVLFNSLGDLQLRLGETEKALKYYEDGSAIFEKLVELDSKNAQYQHDLSLSFSKLGDFQLRLGEAEKALNYFHDGLVVREKLVELDPKNAQYQRDLFVSYYKLSTVFRAESAFDPEKAREYLTRALNKLKEMKTLGILAPDDERFIEMLEGELASLSE